MPAQAILLARVGALAPFISFLDAIGAPCERLLETERLAPDLMEDPNALFPLRQGLRFIDAAARSQGINDLGVIVGRRSSIAGMPPLSALLSRQLTLAKAITLLAQNMRYFNSGQLLSLECRDEWAFFRQCLPSTPHRHAGVFSLILMIDVVRLAAGPRWQPSCVYLPRSESARMRAYEAALEVPCHVGVDCWTVTFDKALLDSSLRFCPDTGVSLDLALARLRTSAPADEFQASLCQVIASMLPLGNPSLRMIADAGGMSGRTLQRRLNESGCTYSELVDNARFELAKRMLREPGVKIVDIAFHLGYSDAANFTRAYRRWTGSPPKAARCAQASSLPPALTPLRRSAA